MVSLGQLWLPIVLSAVLVFISSALLHMVLKYHNADYHKFSNEDEVRAAISKGAPAPGQYIIPYCASPKDAADPAMAEKFIQGPVGLVFLRKPGPMQMGPQLGQWFVLALVVSALTALVGIHALPPGSPYRLVFHVTALTGFLGYAMARAQSAIWQGEPWSVTLKTMFDGLIYAMVAAGTFGWLWPKA